MATQRLAQERRARSLQCRTPLRCTHHALEGLLVRVFREVDVELGLIAEPVVAKVAEVGQRALVSLHVLCQLVFGPKLPVEESRG